MFTKASECIKVLTKWFLKTWREKVSLSDETRMVNEIWSRRDQKYDLTLVSSWPAFGLIVTSLWSHCDQPLVSSWPAFGHKNRSFTRRTRIWFVSISCFSFDLLTLSSSVATRQCANKFALPSLLHRFSPRHNSNKFVSCFWNEWERIRIIILRSSESALPSELLKKQTLNILLSCHSE